MNYEKIFKIPVRSEEIPDLEGAPPEEVAAFKREMKISGIIKKCFESEAGQDALNYLVINYVTPEVDGLNVVQASGEAALIEKGARSVVVDILQRIRIAEQLSSE